MTQKKSMRNEQGSVKRNRTMAKTATKFLKQTEAAEKVERNEA